MIKKDPWTDEEDYELLKLVLHKGRKWSLVAKMMEGKRT